MNLLVSMELVRSSSMVSVGLNGRKTGLKERLPSGVVGAVEVSSTSTTGSGKDAAIMALCVSICG